MNRLLLGLLLTCAGACASFAQEFSQAELEKMVKELDAVSVRNPKYKYPIRCVLEKDEEVNAGATVDEFKEGETPQSVMLVNTGLLKFIKNDRRILRAVVAHEIAHLMLGHVLSPVYKANDLRILYTRQKEMAADTQGAILLEKAGYAKKDMVDMLFKLDELERTDTWMRKLSANDHTSAKNRAAEVAGNPEVMRAMMSFEKALAFMETRRYNLATTLFEKAYAQEPKCTEALVNAAQSSLMFYYESLPEAVQNEWFLPDFGPLLANPIANGKDPNLGLADRERFKQARTRIEAAKAKLPTDEKVLELEALAAVMDPDASTDVLIKGGAALEQMMSGKADGEKLRYANNAAFGFHRAKDDTRAWGVLIGTQRGTNKFNPLFAQNFARFSVPSLSTSDQSLAAAVMVTWLNNTASDNPYYLVVKNHYTKSCEKLGIKPEELKPAPSAFCTPSTLNVGGKEAPLFLETGQYIEAFGEPLVRLTILKEYPDLQSWVWAGGSLMALVERGQIVRATTMELGASVELKPVDTANNKTYRITVGMSEDELGKILDLSKALEKNFIGTDKIETWSYFPGLMMGVLRKDGKIAGITISPTKG